MNTYTYQDILQSINTHTAHPEWLNTKTIQSERSQVEQYIHNGGQAYGFTTLFGHLDNLDGNNTTMTNILYNGHNIGYKELLDKKLALGILSMKLCHLSNGGTGISIHTYNTLMQLYETMPEVYIDMDSSYGSGDVATASQFFYSLLEQHYDFPTGDLMILINGSYIAEGLILGLHDDIVASIDYSIHLIEKGYHILHNNHHTDVQLSVSMRDIQPLYDMVDTTLDNMHTNINNSLNKITGNPRFVFQPETTSVSNSSFLDFNYSTMINNVIELYKIISAYLVSTTFHMTKYYSQQSEKKAAAFIQYPKVSRSYYNNIKNVYPTSDYGISESFMIEDIADGKLHKVNCLRNIMNITNKQQLLLQELYDSTI